MDLDNASDQDSEEYNSSCSSIEFNTSNIPRLPHISLQPANQEIVAQKNKTSPTLDEVDPGLESFGLALASLRIIKDDVEGGSPRESEEFHSSSSSIDIVHGTKSLAPHMKNDIDAVKEDIEDESEEFESSRSSLEIVSQAGISHAPRIASVLVDGNILKETKEVVFKSENTDGKLEKYHLTNIPLQNVDSPQESEELNSSVSSLNYNMHSSVSLVPRASQVYQLNDVTDPVLPGVEERRLEALKTENSSTAGMQLNLTIESEEFKSSNSSIDIVPVPSGETLKPRKSIDEISIDSTDNLKDDGKKNSKKAPSITSSNKTETGTKGRGVTESQIPIADDDQKEDPLQKIELKPKDVNKFRQIKPRNSALIVNSVRSSKIKDSSSEESISEETVTEEDEDDDEDIEEAKNKTLASEPMDPKSKYYRCYVPKTVSKPKGSSVVEQVGFYFALYDQKCYFSGFIYKKNELGQDGNLLNKKHILRQNEVVERGGEWVKYWAELLGGEMFLWRVPADLHLQVDHNDSNIDEHKDRTNYVDGRGIDGLIQAELFPSIECIKTIKLKSAPFIILLANSSTELHKLPLRLSETDDNLPPPIPYTSLFSVSNQGRNKFTFATQSIVTSNLWIKAIQLSVFENDQINFVFAMKLLKDSRYMNVWTDLGITPYSCGLKSSAAPFEGLVGARHAIEVEARNYYAIISQVVSDFARVKKDNKSHNRKSHIFGRSKKDKDNIDEPNDSEQVADDIKGQISLFQDEADYRRGHRSIMKIEDVYSAFIVWPRAKSSVDNDLVTSIKIYGNIQYSFPGEAKKKDRRSRRTWYEHDKPSDFSKDIQLESYLRTGDSYLLFSFSDTQESLRFLVSLWNAFGIEAKLETCNEKEKIWFDPPPRWGCLSLKLDELVGDLLLVDFRNAFDLFNVLMHDKFKSLGRGLFQEWVYRVKSTVDFHDSIEKEEIRQKAEALIKLSDSFPKDCILPEWLVNEFESRKISLKNVKVKSPGVVKSQNVTSESNHTAAISPHKNTDPNSDLVQVEMHSVIQPVKVEMDSVIQPVKVEMDSVIQPVKVGEIQPSPTTAPTPPTRGATRSLYFSSSPNPETQEHVGTRNGSINNALSESYLADSESSPGASTSSSSENSSVELVPESEKSYLLDLTRTIPKDINLDIQDLISSWTAEEVARFQNHVAWIADDTESQEQSEKSQTTNLDNLIFDSKSLLGTGLQPRRKKEIINGPLISAIPASTTTIDKKIIPDRIPLDSKADDINFTLEDMIFQDGLLGQKKQHVSHVTGNGLLISAIPINKDEVKPVNSLEHGLVGKMQTREILGQKKLHGSHGPLISAIPIATDEIKQVNSLDQGLVGKMQSRESFMMKSKAVEKEAHSRQSYIHPNPVPTSSTVYQNYYGYPNYAGQSNSFIMPSNDSTYFQNVNSSFSHVANLGHPSVYGNSMGNLPIEYQQALMYQQYMYAIEAQQKPKKKKKSKKKDKKKKKKESMVPPNTMNPQMVPYYMHGYITSSYPENVIRPSETQRPSSSEESEESEEFA